MKLVQNFRSHAHILRFPNGRFYGGELQCCGAPRVLERYLDSSVLATRGFPVVFHAICGEDAREASSPSFFNVDEITIVKEYVERLKADRRVRTSTSPPTPS